MSILKVNSIEPANAGSEDYFLARAWINYNQIGTQSIHAEGNISSITDVAVGKTSFVFGNNMSASSYVIVASPTEYGATNGVINPCIGGTYNGGSTQTTSGFGMSNQQTNVTGTLYDMADNFVMVIE